MKFLHYIFILFFGASLHASFYREGVIAPTSPLAVLDPVKRSEIERLTQNLRFFGDLNSRPAQDVYVHYQEPFKIFWCGLQAQLLHYRGCYFRLVLYQQ